MEIKEGEGKAGVGRDTKRARARAIERTNDRPSVYGGATGGHIDIRMRRSIICCY